MMRDVREAARAVLASAAPADKTRAARLAASQWAAGALSIPQADSPAPDPGRPARPDTPILVKPGDVPRRRLKSEAGRIALLHAVAHIEFNALDLAFDLVARFAADPRIPDADRADFIGDWITVGDDEARHFVMVNDRLGEMGAAYGDLPAHDGLWEAAEATSDDLAARLAVAPLVLEARGLDVTPGMIARLEGAGDAASADMLKVIYNDEISHVSAGARWFTAVCAAEKADPQARFQHLVRTRFAGNLKSPFNDPAREQAGLPPAFYHPLSSNPHN